jgi:DNA-binding transcriptional MerR regulator
MNVLLVLQPDPHAVYTIEVAAQLARVPRRLIVLYYKHGLVSPVSDPAGGWNFDDNAIRVLRRIEYLRLVCGLNLAAIKLVFGLMEEVERLRSELRFRSRT